MSFFLEMIDIKYWLLRAYWESLEKLQSGSRMDIEVGPSLTCNEELSH